MGIRHVCDCCDGDIDIFGGIINEVKYKNKNTGKQITLELCNRCFAGMQAIGDRVIENRIPPYCSQVECKNCRENRCYYPLYDDCKITQEIEEKSVSGEAEDLRIAKMSEVKMKWLKLNNTGYSPFDNSPEYISICNKCGFINNTTKEYDVCPKCGKRSEGVIFVYGV